MCFTVYYVGSYFMLQSPGEHVCQQHFWYCLKALDEKECTLVVLSILDIQYESYRFLIEFCHDKLN